MTQGSTQRPAAIIIGSSGAIGGALASAIEEEATHDVIRVARAGGDIAADLTDPAAIDAMAQRIAGEGRDIRRVFIATGLLHRDGRGPEKSIADLDADWLIENYRANALGPLLVAAAILPLMPRTGSWTTAILSARVGSISDNSLGGWYGYRMAKAALNMAIRNLAVEWRRKNDRAIIVGLHPGTVDSPLSKPFQGRVAPGKLFDPERAALQLLDVVEALKPADSGRLFAWDGSEIAP